MTGPAKRFRQSPPIECVDLFNCYKSSVHDLGPQT